MNALVRSLGNIQVTALVGTSVIPTRAATGTFYPVDNIEIDPSIESNIIESMMWWRKGDKIIDHLVSKFGIVFLRFDTLTELLNKSKNMQELISADVKPDVVTKGY